MEDNSSGNDMLNYPTSLEEVVVDRRLSIVKANSFPFRFKKEDKVPVISLTGKSGLNNNVKLEIPGCSNTRDGQTTSSAPNDTEDLTKERTFTENRSSVSDSQLLPSVSSIHPNEDTSQEICSEICAKPITRNPKENTQPVLKVGQTPKTTMQTDDTGRWVVHIDPSDASSRGDECYSAGSNNNNGTLHNSTTSQQFADSSLPELRPQRPSRRMSSHRNTSRSTETPLTQIHIDPINNIPLPSHVEEALGIFNQFKSYQPTVGSAIFSILMTIVFVGILWIVVYTIFGPKGHAIAGIFLSIFILGFLLNTCLVKFYFRLRLFFGIERLREQSIMARNIAALEQQREEELRQQRALEPPPSYSSVMDSPPPYSIAKHMNSQQLEETSIKYQESANSSVKHQHTNDSIAMIPLTPNSSVKPQQPEEAIQPSSTATCGNCLIKESGAVTQCPSCKTSACHDYN